MGAIEDLTDLLQRVKAQGKTIIIAEHRIWYLMDVADRVVYMHGGKILKDMTLNDFRHCPKVKFLPGGFGAEACLMLRKLLLLQKQAAMS